MTICVKKVTNSITLESYIKEIHKKYCEKYNYKALDVITVDGFFGLEMPTANITWMKITLETMSEVLEKINSLSEQKMWLTVKEGNRNGHEIYVLCLSTSFYNNDTIFVSE
jgi:hypothetical protein